MHSQRLEYFLDYENIIPVELFYPIIKKMDVIVAPDKGVLDLTRKISKDCGLSLAFMKKTRPAKERAKILEMKGDVKNKKAIIIDDMISTGGTILEASKKLKQEGAKEVYVIATHGVFSKGAIRKIEKSQIKKVYITNSLPQFKHSKKIKAIDLSRFIEKTITR